MATKRVHVNSAKNCVCQRCSFEAHAVPDTLHRRCGGTEGAPLRSVHENAPVRERGRWFAK
jgi:hypothetical protein